MTAKEHWDKRVIELNDSVKKYQTKINEATAALKFVLTQQEMCKPKRYKAGTVIEGEYWKARYVIANNVGHWYLLELNTGIPRGKYPNGFLNGLDTVTLEDLCYSSVSKKVILEG